MLLPRLLEDLRIREQHAVQRPAAADVEQAIREDAAAAVDPVQIDVVDATSDVRSVDAAAPFVAASHDEDKQAVVVAAVVVDVDAVVVVAVAVVVVVVVVVVGKRPR